MDGSRSSITLDGCLGLSSLMEEILDRVVPFANKHFVNIHCSFRTNLLISLNLHWIYSISFHGKNIWLIDLKIWATFPCPERKRKHTYLPPHMYAWEFLLQKLYSTLVFVSLLPDYLKKFLIIFHLMSSLQMRWNNRKAEDVEWNCGPICYYV